MLNNISWASYVFAISIIVVIYYIFVILLFYRRELQNAFFKSHKSQYHSELSIDGLSMQEKGFDKAEQSSEAAEQTVPLPDFLLTLQNLVSTGASNNFPKEEILMSLKLKLQQYHSFKDSGHQVTINQYILTAFESICSIHLSEEDISALWIK